MSASPARNNMPTAATLAADKTASARASVAAVEDAVGGDHPSQDTPAVPASPSAPREAPEEDADTEKDELADENEGTIRSQGKGKTPEVAQDPPTESTGPLSIPTVRANRDLVLGAAKATPHGAADEEDVRAWAKQADGWIGGYHFARIEADAGEFVDAEFDDALATCRARALEYADVSWIKAFPDLMQGCEGELKRRETERLRQAEQRRREEAKERAKEREARENDRRREAEQRRRKEAEERDAQDRLAAQRQRAEDVLRWNVICEADYQEEKRRIDDLKHAGELTAEKAQDRLRDAVAARKAKLATPPQFIPGGPSVKSSATRSSGGVAKKRKTQGAFVEISKPSPSKSSASSKLKGKLRADSKAVEKARDKGKGKGKPRPKASRRAKLPEVERISPPPDWKPCTVCQQEGIECLPKVGEPGRRSRPATQGRACQACTVRKAACSNSANTGKRAAAAAAASTSLVDWQRLAYVPRVAGDLTADEADLFRLDRAIADASFEIAAWESRRSLAQAQCEAIRNRMSTPGAGPSRPLRALVIIFIK
ncbi:hypothetical protein BC834DRAFT_847135 [Gloeopeniophorella convolvens]|nr:hypothetical protein BC834DRAFT_847135 [Gloeopeniophorella convolvens]